MRDDYFRGLVDALTAVSVSSGKSEATDTIVNLMGMEFMREQLAFSRMAKKRGWFR